METKMTSEDYRRFCCVVAGDNPLEQMKPYDSNLKCERHLKYRYEDAEKIRQQYISLYEKVVESDSVNDMDKEMAKEALNSFRESNSDDFYYDLTLDYDLDPDTGDAYSTQNENGKWSDARITTSGVIPPFILLDGTTASSAKKKDIDWSKMHKHGIETYTAVWETVVEGRKPTNEYEEKLYNNMKNATEYFNKFGSKENYVTSCTSFWGYAFLSKETGWLELEPNVEQFSWMNNFYDRFIVPLDDDTTITIVECKR